MNAALAQAANAPQSSGGGWFLTILLVIALSYFIPFFIAWRRGACNLVMIFLGNLLLAWTVVGWVVVMLWAALGQTKDQRAFYREVGRS